MISHPKLGDFRIISNIGVGSYSTVYLAESVDYHFVVAIKKLWKGVDVRKEAILTARAEYPLIVDIFDVFEFNGHQCILMEFVEGETLLDYANSMKISCEEEAKFIFAEIAMAVNHLHNTVHIAHRDLKCENVMINPCGDVKLIDFGFACEGANLMQTQCGSPCYMAPELIQGSRYTKEVDIWSLGIILYAITNGDLPFNSDNDAKLFDQILNQKPAFKYNLSPELIDLISGMLRKNPLERFTIKEVLNHPWLQVQANGQIVYPNVNAPLCLKAKTSEVLEMLNGLNVTINPNEIYTNQTTRLYYCLAKNTIERKHLRVLRSMLYTKTNTLYNSMFSLKMNVEAQKKKSFMETKTKTTRLIQLPLIKKRKLSLNKGTYDNRQTYKF